MVRDWRVYQEAGAVRVIPAGHVLMHFMWFMALTLLLLGRPGRRMAAFYVAQLLFIGGGHILAYTRAQWVAMLAGVGALAVLLLPRYSRYLGRAAVLTLCVAMLLAASVAGGLLRSGPASPFITGVAQRFGSLLNPSETAETGSLQWRDYEIEKAFQALEKQPLTGVGLGSRYRNVTVFMEESSGWWTRGSIAAGEVSRFTRYVHNSYVSIAVKMGIPGIAVLLLFFAAALWKGFQAYRKQLNPEYQAVILGAVIGCASMLIWCYYHAHLIKAESTPVIAVMVALCGLDLYSRPRALRARQGRPAAPGERTGDQKEGR
jgi:O-antigen ligase